MGKPLSIATFAVPLSGNKGSVSMFLGLKDAFEDLGIDIDFHVFSYYYKADFKRSKSFERVSIHPGHPKEIAFSLLPSILFFWAPLLLSKRMRKAVKELKQADIVLLVGGTTFSDSMLFKVPWNMLAALPAILLKKKIIFVSQTIGPAKKNFNKSMAKWTLKRAELVHGRGTISANWASKIIGKEVEYRPDLSFTMKVPKWEDVIKEHPSLYALNNQISTKKAIGVVPNTIVLKKAEKAGIDYISFLSNAIKEISIAGFLPVLIPHSYRKQTKGYHNNDRLLCLSLIEKLSPDTEYVFLDEDFSPNVLRAIIGQMKLLVASRFHSMISSLSMSVPPLTYGWGYQKYIEVLNEFNCEKLYHSFKEIHNENFREQLKHALNNYELYKSKIKKALPKIIQDSKKLPNELVKLKAKKNGL